MAPDETLLFRMKAVLRVPDTLPAMRRYFVNTMFDSTFVILGVIIGSAFATEPNLNVVIATILMSSLALGISTGISVYEAEKMEQQRRIKEIENAMLSSLKDTDIARMSAISTLLISAVNFSAPLLICAVALSPFLLLPPEDIRLAAWIASGLGLSILFITGAVLGRMSGQNPLIKGTRMLVLGAIAFTISYWIGSML